VKSFLATARLCIRSKNDFGLLWTLGEYLLKLIALLAQWMVWCAILPEGAEVDGLTRSSMLVYISVSSALSPLLDVRTPASGWLHDGTMLSLFMRPSPVYAQLMAHSFGSWLIPLVFYGLPVLTLSALLGCPPVVQATLGNDAGTIGAAYLEFMQ